MFEIAIVAFFASLAVLLVSALILAWSAIRDSCNPRTTRLSLVFFVTALVISAVTFAWPIRPFLLRAKQVRTFANLQTVEASLAAYFERNRRYPDGLADALDGPRKALLVDGWGNLLSYESRTDRYLVISLGRDGKPDRPEYWTIRERNPDHGVWVAGNWNADQVLSDRGFLYQAGK